MKKQHEAQALFQSVGSEGAGWLFVVGSDGGWAILRNGQEFDIGTSEAASVVSGVKKFLSLTHGIAKHEIAADPILGALIDRIERGGPLTEAAGKHRERMMQDASKRSADHFAK